MEDSNTIGNCQENEDLLYNDTIGDNESDKMIEIASTSHTKRKRRLTSAVWTYFDLLPLENDGKQRCKCKKCGVHYLCDSKFGTGNLKRHLQTCKKRDTRDIGQLLLQSNSSYISMCDVKFDQQEFRDLLSSCIIKHDMPFQCVEWSGFQALLLYLRRDLQIVSRNTVRNDCMKMFKREKEKMQAILKKTSSRVSLTSDLWTSINTDGFICLTVHFIDNSWKLQKKIINFGFMPPPHDGLALFEILQTFLSTWGIENKIFSITLDNASANTVSVDFMRNHLNLRGGLLCHGEFFHVRCCAHIINLIVHDGLKGIDSSIIKVRESIKYVKGSQARKQKFLECAKQSFLDEKRGLRQDVPTRWNSTFIMLDSAIYYKRAFLHLQLGDSNYKCCPSSIEWEQIMAICNFLAPFYDITCIFSGTKYPTANLYFPAISTAYASLKHESFNDNEYIRRMATSMLSKFEKYWFIIICYRCTFFLHIFLIAGY